MSAQLQYMNDFLPEQDSEIRKAHLRSVIRDAERWLHLLPELEHVFGPLLTDLRRHSRRTPERDVATVLREIGRGAWTVSEICEDGKLTREEVVLILEELVSQRRVSMREVYQPGTGLAGKHRVMCWIFCPPKEPYGSNVEVPKPGWTSAFTELMTRDDE